MNACTFPNSGYTGGKPRGPVRKNTTELAFATPNDKRGFVMPKFFGDAQIRAAATWLWGMVGATRKDVRMASSMFLTTMLHPLRVRTQTVVLHTQLGVGTMTAITQASSIAAQTSSKSDSIPASQLQAVLGAFNATNLASSYIERGNFAAARRKLTLALAAINQINSEA